MVGNQVGKNIKKNPPSKNPGKSYMWKIIGPVAQSVKVTFYEFLGTYPLNLIHCRKGNWLHMGSSPIVPTM